MNSYSAPHAGQIRTNSRLLQMFNGCVPDALLQSQPIVIQNTDIAISGSE